MYVCLIPPCNDVYGAEKTAITLANCATIEQARAYITGYIRGVVDDIEYFGHGCGGYVNVKGEYFGLVIWDASDFQKGGYGEGYRFVPPAEGYIL